MATTSEKRQALVRVDEIPEGQGKRVRVADHYVALFKVEGDIFAINALCPHAGAFLDMGWMAGHTVHCPMHGWDFDVRTGVSETYCAETQCYDVEVEDGVVYLKTPLC